MLSHAVPPYSIRRAGAVQNAQVHKLTNTHLLLNNGGNPTFPYC